MSCEPIVVVVEATPAATVVNVNSTPTVVQIGIQGPSGVSPTSDISTDAGNQLTNGSDNKLFVPPFSSVDLGTFN